MQMTTLAAKPQKIINHDKKVYFAAIVVCIDNHLPNGKFCPTRFNISTNF